MKRKDVVPIEDDPAWQALIREARELDANRGRLVRETPERQRVLDHLRRWHTRDKAMSEEDRMSEAPRDKKTGPVILIMLPAYDDRGGLGCAVPILEGQFLTDSELRDLVVLGASKKGYEVTPERWAERVTEYSNGGHTR